MKKEDAIMKLLGDTASQKSHEFFKLRQRFDFTVKLDRSSVSCRIVERSRGITVELFQFFKTSGDFCVRSNIYITQQSRVAFLLCFCTGCFIGGFVCHAVSRKNDSENTAKPAELNTYASKSSTEYKQKVHKVISATIECFGHHLR